MDEHIEQKESKNIFCNTCRQYYRQYADGNCPTCNKKLTEYIQTRNYYTDKEKEIRSNNAINAHIKIRLDKYDSEIRMINRKMEKLELRSLQIISLFKDMLSRYKRGHNPTKLFKQLASLTLEKPDEPVDLVDNLVNFGGKNNP